jgi:predicted transcriptional regulator
MSFRVTPAFKAKLDRAAEESGRSLMQEIELRLELSLDHERHLFSALELGFGRQAAGLMLALGCVIQAGQRAMYVRPLSDPEAFREIVDAINLLLQAIDPDDAHPAAWATLKGAIHAGESPRSDAEFWASIMVEGIADPTHDDDEPLIPIIRNWLGEAVAARLKDRLAQEE